jgi:hypothetical protein
MEDERLKEMVVENITVRELYEWAEKKDLLDKQILIGIRNVYDVKKVISICDCYVMLKG